MIKELYNRISATQKSRTRFLAGVVVVIGITVLSLAMCNDAKADVPVKPLWSCEYCQGEQGPPGPPGPAGMDGKDYLHDDNSWSNNDLDQMFAASTAMAGIDFDSTTSKLQLGIALGGFNGETAGAVGIGKVLDNKKFGDILVSFKTTFDEEGRSGDEARPWVASATWKIKLQ